MNIIPFVTLKRQWGQFRLWTLLVLIAAISVPLAALRYRWDRKQRERSTIARIEQLRAVSVGFDWQARGDKDLPGPEWARKLLGDDFFAEVVAVGQGTVNGISPRDGLDDAALGSFENLPHLKVLYLYSHLISDAGLVHLRGLTDLETLHLVGSGVTGEGIGQLERCTRLKELDLAYTCITDTRLTCLNSLPNLERLSLRHTRVTDDGLLHLRTLSMLRRLDLEFCDITDSALIYLKGLTNLEELWLAGTGVTVAGATVLQQSLPHCVIVWDQNGEVRQ